MIPLRRGEEVASCGFRCPYKRNRDPRGHYRDSVECGTLVTGRSLVRWPAGMEAKVSDELVMMAKGRWLLIVPVVASCCSHGRNRTTRWPGAIVGSPPPSFDPFPSTPLHLVLSDEVQHHWKTWRQERVSMKIADETSRDYLCKTCAKTFGRAEHLRRHELTHSSDNKPFKCSSCPKSFIRRYISNHRP